MAFAFAFAEDGRFFGAAAGRFIDAMFQWSISPLMQETAVTDIICSKQSKTQWSIDLLV